MLQHQSTIALIASLLLCAYFVIAGDASVRAKAIVGALFLVSVAMEYRLHRWGLAGLLLQIALAIGVLMHMKARSHR